MADRDGVVSWEEAAVEIALAGRENILRRVESGCYVMSIVAGQRRPLTWVPGTDSLLFQAGNAIQQWRNGVHVHWSAAVAWARLDAVRRVEAAAHRKLPVDSPVRGWAVQAGLLVVQLHALNRPRQERDDLAGNRFRDPDGTSRRLLAEAHRIERALGEFTDRRSDC